LTDNKALSYGSIDIASKSPKHRTSLGLSSFSGQMQQLIINGKSYFELINNGDLGISVNKTISFSRADLPHKYPINIKNNKSWLKLPKIEAFHILIVQFHFKTKEENGLILYNSGQNSDYIAVEMVDGQIHYMFSLGKEKILIKSKSKEKLNDNKWHLVTIWRPTKTNHELSVDSLIYKFSSTYNEYNQFNLIDPLYIGGFTNQSMYQTVISKSKIVSSYGFMGCLASIEINGRVPDFDDILKSNDKTSGSITKGCDSKMIKNCIILKIFLR
jgi:neurexin